MSRIYVVDFDMKRSDGATCLVRADSIAQARDHVVSVRVASQDDLVKLLPDYPVQHATINEPAPKP